MLNAFASFKAISGVTLYLPLIIADKVLRVVVKPFATSSMVRHLPVSSGKPSIVSLIRSPGWARSNIAISLSLSHPTGEIKEEPPP